MVTAYVLLGYGERGEVKEREREMGMGREGETTFCLLTELSIGVT